jgi:hypothetical protein
VCLCRWDCTHVKRRLRIKIVNLEFACSFLYFCFATLTHFFLCKGSDIWVWYHKHSFWLSIFRQETRCYTCLTFYYCLWFQLFHKLSIAINGMVRIDQIWWTIPNRGLWHWAVPLFESIWDDVYICLLWSPSHGEMDVNGMVGICWVMSRVDMKWHVQLSLPTATLVATRVKRLARGILGAGQGRENSCWKKVSTSEKWHKKALNFCFAWLCFGFVFDALNFCEFCRVPSWYKCTLQNNTKQFRFNLKTIYLQ